MPEWKSTATDTEHAAVVIGALDSEQRLQIVLRLAERDHVVHELVAALGKSQPLISQHLRVLKRAGLVTSTRAGREVAYHLCVPETADIITLAERVGAAASAAGVVELDSRRPDSDSVMDSEDYVAGGKVAIEGPMTDDSLETPGLIPDLPTPPSPRVR